MKDAEVAAQLIDALNAAADREAGAKTGLVSVALEMLRPPEAGDIHVRLQRKTRTLIFMSAEYAGRAGAPSATASSVHKVLA